jgi:hypoxia-inducible factor (prolyl hydroxylase)
MFNVGDAVVLQELRARPDLNGSVGLILHHVVDSDRWAVKIQPAGTYSECVKVKACNLKLHASSALHTLTRGGSDDDAFHESIADSMFERHYAVVDGFLQSGRDVEAFQQLLRELRSSLGAGDVAGGRAAAAYARITKQALPRGDLMRFLSQAEATEHLALQPALAAIDAVVQGLQRSPRLAEEWSRPDGCPVPPLRREEMQVTCYPGDGARYVRHIDNNAPVSPAHRRTGRRVTCILYANPCWEPSHGGELRIYQHEDTPESTRVDVAPLSNRLCLFWSDARVPHEVLPTHEERYALSVWYEDHD